MIVEHLQDGAQKTEAVVRRGCLLLMVHLQEVVHRVNARIAFGDGRILVLETVSDAFEVPGQFRACLYEKWQRGGGFREFLRVVRTHGGGKK